uniref:Uncharacterized protein n=1 Tax=Myotis lucifugus TaxID=59463 RepID=G1NW52_MYOLU
RNISALKIQRAWLSYMDRTIFQLLKHTICAAEYCVTYDILKNVSPVEAEFLKDAGNKCKVKFRFSGEKFPPFIVFKIFLHTGGYGYKYFSGKNMLKPSSKASYDAYKIMGRKKFLEQILEDEYLFQKFKITDEMDIVTVQDYVTEPLIDRPDTKQQRRVVFSAPSFDIVKYKVPLSDEKLEDKEPFFWSQKLYVHRYP